MTDHEIRPNLRSKIFGKNLYCFDVIDSTNLKAKLLIQDGAGEGGVVIADEQTSGRGRLNRTWVSEPSKNLTFSVIIEPKISPEKIGVLSLYAGVAVADAVRLISGIHPVCKWPNDILIGGKKVCGILSEAVFIRNMLAGVVIGIGLNVNQTIFPEEIKSSATSLFVAAGKEYNRFEVLGTLLERMEYYYGHIEHGRLNTIIDTWGQYSSMFGNEVSINQNGKLIKGIALRLDDDGGLFVHTDNGGIKVLAGDVTLCS